MSTIGMVRDLAGFFLWVGIAGAGIALLCAIIVGVALAIGNAGLAGGTGAVWIGGALLSLGAGFSGQWIPAIVAAGALIAALVLGPVARSALRAFERRRPAPAGEADHRECTAAGSVTYSGPAGTARGRRAHSLFRIDSIDWGARRMPVRRFPLDPHVRKLFPHGHLPHDGPPLARHPGVLHPPAHRQRRAAALPGRRHDRRRTRARRELAGRRRRDRIAALPAARVRLGNDERLRDPDGAGVRREGRRGCAALGRHGHAAGGGGQYPDHGRWAAARRTRADAAADAARAAAGGDPVHAGELPRRRCDDVLQLPLRDHPRDRRLEDAADLPHHRVRAERRARRRAGRTGRLGSGRCGAGDRGLAGRLGAAVPRIRPASDAGAGRARAKTGRSPATTSPTTCDWGCRWDSRPRSSRSAPSSCRWR